MATTNPATTAETNGEFTLQMPKSVRKLRETWTPYREAVLGFRNHWYAVGFSRELEGDKPIARKICGEPIIFKRVDGKVYGLEDRCAHRRIPLSMRFECHTKETITCWYHAFTYDWRDGKLVTVLTDPHCELIGKVKLKTYPVEEAKGLLFVFIGDIEPPPLADDLPPEFLEEDRELEGRFIEVKSNWRWGCENGIDSPHFYIHRNSPYIEWGNFQSPIALSPKPDHFERLRYVTGPGPKGIIDPLFDNYDPIFSADIGDAKEVVKANIPPDGQPLFPDISMWLPCDISVKGFPWADLHDFEFYVPVDANNHLYFQLVTKVCKTEEEREQLHRDVEEKWTKWAFDLFNGDDVLAREGLEDGYEHGDGWNEETLTRTDGALIAWRQFASQYCRGIQKPAPSRG